MRTVVSVSDFRVSDNSREELITYALGSCLGVSIYDPHAMVGGLLHVMLPLSTADPGKAAIKPAMFVDTGFQEVLNKCYERGARKKNMEIVVAGGASMKHSTAEDYFKIGKRNFTILRKLLWKNGFMIAAQDVGGVISRTMMLRMADGMITINKQPFYSSQQAETNKAGY